MVRSQTAASNMSRSHKEITPVNPDSKLFQRNAAAFYGQVDCNKSISSQGSVFQKNAAQFYGMEAPQAGERPFNIKKPSVEEVKNSKGFSVLNE